MLFGLGKVSSKEYNKLKGIKQELEVKLEDKTRVIDSLKNENGDLRSRLQETEYRLKMAEEDNAKLTGVVNNQMNELNRLNVKNAELSKTPTVELKIEPKKRGRKPKDKKGE